MKNNMKLCKDCKHCRSVSFHRRECHRRDKFVTITDDTTGKSKRELTNVVDCDDERGYFPLSQSWHAFRFFLFWKCGKNAKFFESITNKSKGQHQ